MEQPIALEREPYKQTNTFSEKRHGMDLNGPSHWDSGDAEKMRRMVARDRELHDEGRKIGGKLHRMALKSGFRLIKRDVDGARSVLREGLSSLASLDEPYIEDDGLDDRSSCKVNAKTMRYAASSGIEDAAGALLFYHWISEKEVLTLCGLKDALNAFDSIPFKLSDTDFIAGCCKLADSICHRCIFMASELDFQRIKSARDTVWILHGYLLRLNFRNGRNRRQFDVVKYKVSFIEGVGPEEHGLQVSVNNELPVEFDEKWNQMFEEIELRHSALDDHRELLLRKIRDIERISKQAIFSLHRGDVTKAEEMIRTSAGSITKLQGDLHQHLEPIGRGLEEFAEAVFFLRWVQKEQIELLDSSLFQGLSVRELLGGICDFTGEVNRMAVGRATKRDLTGVKTCYIAVSSIQEELVDADSIHLKGKWETLCKTVSKIEVLVLDLSLSKVSSRGHVRSVQSTTEVLLPPPESTVVKYSEQDDN